MKKVSTAATTLSRNFSQSNLTIGLDLGDRSSCYCVLDETGRIVTETESLHQPKALQFVKRLKCCKVSSTPSQGNGTVVTPTGRGKDLAELLR